MIEGDLLSGAVTFAREIADKPIPKTRERTAKLGSATDNAAVFARGARTARKKQRGMMAPLAAIDAVEAATKMPFDEGCQAERKLFIECLFSDQSKALIHVFFGEREVAKIPDIPKDTPAIPVNRAAVVGAGTMGGGIAMVFANAGIPVLLKETDQAALDRGHGHDPEELRQFGDSGPLHPAIDGPALALITPVLTYDGFADADMVIEAVFEGMALKKKVFAELDSICKPGAILATNTSTLNIDEIASRHVAARSGDRHALLQPRQRDAAAGNRARQGQSSKEVIATCMQLSKKLGKVGVLVGNCRGFVGNRMFGPYRREAQFLVEEGAAVEAVDKALYDFGMAMGPLATGDLAGLDVGWRIRKEYRHLRKTRRPSALRRRSPVRTGPLRPEDGARAGTSTTRTAARSTIRKSTHSSRSGPQKQASRSARSPRRDRRPLHLCAGERRRAHPRRRLRPARRRHRHHLPQRLRISGLSRRPHVVRRHRGAAEGLRAHLRIRAAARRTVGARAAAASSSRNRARRSPISTRKKRGRVASIKQSAKL